MRPARLLSLLGICLACAAAASVVAPLPIPPDLVVALDGTGDFSSVHAAVQSIPLPNRERKIIFVKNGIYAEQVRVDAAYVTLRGETRAGTRLEFPLAASDRTPAPERAVLNLSATAHDFVLENLTVINTHGQLGIHAFAIFGLADRTVLLDADVFSQGNDTLSLWRDGGRNYHARLHVRGSVDFICPRGWCFIRDSTITQLNPPATAATWYNGSGYADKKFVLRNCTFNGPPDWHFARRHHDANFYLIDCTFSQNMRDKAPYQDNLANAPGAPRPEQLTAAWTFAHGWDPERTDAPRIVLLRHQAQPDRLIVTFSEAVTVRGHPRLAFSNGEVAELLGGSGTNTLEFSSPHAAFGGTVPTLQLNGGAIFSSEAGARIRLAALKLP